MHQLDKHKASMLSGGEISHESSGNPSEHENDNGHQMDRSDHSSSYRSRLKKNHERESDS